MTFSNLGDPQLLGGFGFGALTWTNGSQAARSPVAVRTAPLAFPAAVSGSGASGEVAFEVEFGYAGAFHVNALGLAAPLGFAGTVLDDRLAIACGNGAVRPVLLQREGRSPLPLPEFLRGTAVPAGTRLA